MDKPPKISIDNLGILKTNRQNLRADVIPTNVKSFRSISSENFTGIISARINREVINSYIDTTRNAQLQAKPSYTIGQPFIYAAQLGTSKEAEGRTTSQVFTEEGWLSASPRVRHDQLREGFVGHWNAVRMAGYVPEVQRLDYIRRDGQWLTLRKPSIPEVAEDWFGYVDDPERKDKKLEVIEQHISQPWDHEATRKAIIAYRIIGERAITARNYNVETQANQQVGLLLAVAALRNFVGDENGYIEEAESAIELVHHTDSVDVSAYRALHNSTYGTLST
jgi:hypothetical protein